MQTKKPLADGEYAFFYAGNTPIVGFGLLMGSGGKLYDFGIKAGGMNSFTFGTADD